MPLDIFLKVDGVEGEAHDRAHAGEIAVLSYAWGAANAGSSGGAAGKPTFQNLSVVKPIDRSSPTLFLWCASGRHIKQCVLAVRHSAEAGDFASVELTDCLIASVAASGSRDAGAASGTIAIGFAAIAVECRRQKPDGSLGAPVAAGWNVKANAPT